MSTPNKKAKKAAPKLEEKSSLPKNVTEEPRNSEEIHLKLIKHQPSLVNTYLDVSNDKGETLQEEALETAVKEHCDKYFPMKAKSLKEPEKLLAETKSLATVYTRQVNFRDNTLNGNICKYRIRQGILFLIMKKAVKAAGKGWEEWFTENFSGSDFRSAQDAMKLAKAKNSIGFAFLGKFRLLQILRQIKDYEKAEDPIRAYLEANGIDFDPEKETIFEEVKNKVAVAINFNKLQGAGFTEISKQQVESFVSNGKEVDSALIRDLDLIKKSNGNVVVYFDGLIASDNNPEPVLDKARKVAIFKNTTVRFLTILDNAIADADYRGGIDPGVFAQIKEKVTVLEGKVAAPKKKVAAPKKKVAAPEPLALPN